MRRPVGSAQAGCARTAAVSPLPARRADFRAGAARGRKEFPCGDARTNWATDGIGATLTAGIEPGEVVSMEMSLPLTAAPLRMRAIVRYRDGLRHGFEFLALSGDQREAVARVCEMLAAGG